MGNFPYIYNLKLPPPHEFFESRPYLDFFQPHN